MFVPKKPERAGARTDSYAAGLTELDRDRVFSDVPGVESVSMLATLDCRSSRSRLTLFHLEGKLTRPQDADCAKKESMHVPEDMTIADGLCKYRPQGRVSLVDGVAMITSAITHCRERSMAKLLIDVTELTGYPIPTLADRFWMVQDLPEFIDPGRFGVTAARDAGLKSDVFTSPADAAAWLLANETTPRVGTNAVPEPRLR